MSDTSLLRPRRFRYRCNRCFGHGERCAYAVAGERASLRVSRGGTRAAPTRSHNIINTTCVRATWMETTVAEDRRGKSWMGKRAGEKTR